MSLSSEDSDHGLRKKKSARQASNGTIYLYVEDWNSGEAEQTGVLKSNDDGQTWVG
jgi:hypothetical protein